MKKTISILGSTGSIGLTTLKIINKRKKIPKYLVTVEVNGYAPDYKKIISICNKFKIKFITDSAESLGSKYNKKPLGSYGAISALSFSPNKIITTGQGGAVLTDDKKLFIEVINEIVKYAKKNKITKIAGIEARGFIFGSAAAVQLKIPFIPIRKKNKLPGRVFSQKYKLEYGYDEIQVHQGSVLKKDKILIVDDLIATGGTAIASAKLINKFKPLNISFFFIINLQNLNGLNKLKKDYGVHTLLNTNG